MVIVKNADGCYLNLFSTAQFGRDYRNMQNVAQLGLRKVNERWLYGTCNYGLHAYDQFVRMLQHDHGLHGHAHHVHHAKNLQCRFWRYPLNHNQWNSVEKIFDVKSRAINLFR